MWCTFCDMVVQHKEKTYAALHVKGGKHKKNVEKKPFLVDKPGPTAEVKQEPVPPVEDQVTFLPWCSTIQPFLPCRT